MPDREPRANPDRGPQRPRGRGRPGVRPQGRNPGRPSSSRGAGERKPAADRLAIRPIEGGGFEFAHPSCVAEVRLDYEEAMAAWRSGEPEEARDMLRYALEGCRDNLWIHAALGRLALEHSRNPTLARGHFGYAFELALRAFPTHFHGPLPPDRPANRPFFDALDGLIACHDAQGRSETSAELRRQRARLAGAS